MAAVQRPPLTHYLCTAPNTHTQSTALITHTISVVKLPTTTTTNTQQQQHTQKCTLNTTWIAYIVKNKIRLIHQKSGKNMLLKEMIAEPCNTLAMSEEWIVGVKEEGCSIVKIGYGSSIEAEVVATLPGPKRALMNNQYFVFVMDSQKLFIVDQNLSNITAKIFTQKTAGVYEFNSDEPIIDLAISDSKLFVLTNYEVLTYSFEKLQDRPESSSLALDEIPTSIHCTAQTYTVVYGNTIAFGPDNIFRKHDAKDTVVVALPHPSVSVLLCYDSMRKSLMVITPTTMIEYPSIEPILSMGSTQVQGDEWSAEAIVLMTTGIQRFSFDSSQITAGDIEWGPNEDPTRTKTPEATLSPIQTYIKPDEQHYEFSEMRQQLSLSAPMQRKHSEEIPSLARVAREYQRPRSSTVDTSNPEIVKVIRQEIAALGRELRESVISEVTSLLKREVVQFTESLKETVNSAMASEVRELLRKETANLQHIQATSGYLHSTLSAIHATVTDWGTNLANMNIPDARVLEDVIRRTIAESIPPPNTMNAAPRMMNASPHIQQNAPNSMHGVSNAARPISRPSTATLDLNLPYELSQALQHRDYQTLFYGVISHNDPFLLLTLIKSTPIDSVFTESCELTQDVLLGLLEQISELIMNPHVDMQSKAVWGEIARGVQWAEECAMALHPRFIPRLSVLGPQVLSGIHKKLDILRERLTPYMDPHRGGENCMLAQEVVRGVRVTMKVMGGMLQARE